jgi:hypothetical protein
MLDSVTRLRRLVALDNETGPYVAEMLEDNAERFAELRWLDLFGSDSAAGRPGDEELIAFVTCKHLANLEHLDFGCNRAGDESIQALANSPHMGRLRSLDLCSNAVGVEGWDLIARSRSLKNLRHLDLSYAWPTQPGDLGLQRLMRGRVFRQLKYLAIDSSGVTEDGVARLARSKVVSGLRALSIGGLSREAPLTAAAVRALAGSTRLTGLRWLSLPEVLVTDAEAHLLAKSSGLRGLRELNVSGRRLSDEGKAVLRERFGEGLTLPE